MKILNYLLVSFCLIFLTSTFSLSQDRVEKRTGANVDCKISLKVEFLASEKIGDVALVSNSCNDKSLEQQAFEAAKKMKFEPQLKDGKKVPVTKTVEFTFS